MKPFDKDPMCFAGDGPGNPPAAIAVWAKWEVAPGYFMTVNFNRADATLRSFFTVKGSGPETIGTSVWVHNPTLEQAQAAWRELEEQAMFDGLHNPEPNPDMCAPPTAEAIDLFRRTHDLMKKGGLAADDICADVLGGVGATYETDMMSISVGVRNDAKRVTIVALWGSHLHHEKRTALAQSYDLPEEAVAAVFAIL